MNAISQRLASALAQRDREAIKVLHSYRLERQQR